jgi:ATP-dependent Clp protease ATP-binding subunit ClpC
MSEVPNSAESKKQLFFDEPRLHMSVAGRIMVRIVSLIFIATLTAATIAGFLSAVLWLKWLAAFIALILLDRLFHRKEGDLPVSILAGRNSVNVARAVSPEIIGALERAYDRASLQGTDIAVELARILIDRAEIRDGFMRLDVDAAEAKGKLEEFAGAVESQSSREERNGILNHIMAEAFLNAYSNGHSFIGAVDVFSALPQSGNEAVKRLLSAYSIEEGDLERAMLFSAAKRDSSSIFGIFPRHLGGFAFETHRKLRHRVMNRAWTSRATPLLDEFGTDWSDLARARQSGFLIGHAEEYDHLVNVLSREVNPNALLVGEEGSGKETVISHLAAMIEKDEVPPALFDKRLVSLDVARLVSGADASALGERLQSIIGEIVVAGNIILFIPDMHYLVHTSGSFLSAADALMPILRDNAFPVVGTTYPAEYKQVIAARSDFSGLFEAVEIKEISQEDAERVLIYESLLLESELGIPVTFGAVKGAVTLSKKLFRDKLLPGSAIELLTSAATAASRAKEKLVDHETIIRAAEAKTNVPLHGTSKEESEKLLNLEDTIHGRLIGQEEAVKAVADSLREYRSGLARQGGPIASFLFVGPTGVGKTELAKTLAGIQFGSEAAMVRFDMTEYQSKESFVRFIGSPDGTVGGSLTEAIRKRPFSLILLDEFEKAFPDILDLFLQVLDDGRLTEGSGKTVDFTNTIIIATSNAHSDLINDSLSKGEPMASIADYLKKRLVDVFKPELLNRFSKVVIFRNLELPEVTAIAKLELKKLEGSLSERGLKLEFAPGAAEAIAKLGYEPAFGARPLRRAIDDKIKAPLAEYLLKENPERGARILVSAAENNFTFSQS